ncbi:hypothetical protein BASA81_010198 [Batrachochytrium salamandrivorans]|nr:hypothetical protein BASA81_010198 [Batrachochytrium salamandrivorans]
MRLMQIQRNDFGTSSSTASAPLDPVCKVTMDHWQLTPQVTRWTCNTGMILDQRWLDGTVEHESMGTRHDNRALAAQLADFPAGSVPAVSIRIVEIPPGSPCGSWLTDF